MHDFARKRLTNLLILMGNHAPPGIREHLPWASITAATEGRDNF